MLVTKIQNTNFYSKSPLSFKSSTLPEKKGESHNPNDNKMKTSTKVLIGATSAAAILTAAYFAGKNHLLGDKIYNFLNKEGSKVNPQTPIQRTQNALTPPVDKLEYEICPAVYDKNITIEEGDGLYKIYEDILKNMQADGKTSERLDEVSRSLAQDSSQIYNKLSEITGNANFARKPENIPNERFYMDIAKKRYFSLPENKTEGYSCLDPLKYQKSREEILDLHLGYDALSELNYDGKESKVLNDLRQEYGSKISQEDNSFLDECISKLLPEGAVCHGNKSVLHTHELSRVGKIFREAMGFSVK